MLRPGSHESTAETLNVRDPSRTATDHERYDLQHGTGIFDLQLGGILSLRGNLQPGTRSDAGSPGVMSDMSEDPGAAVREKDVDPFSSEGKAKAREGDSARARFYRKKDELLDWTMDQVKAFSRGSPREFAPMLEIFVKIRGLKNRLDEDGGDEASLSEATLLMQSLRKLVDESGLREARTPSETPDSGTDQG